MTRSDPAWGDDAVFGPAEGLTLDVALRAACVGPPLTVGELDRGRLAPSFRADLLVIPGEAIDELVKPGGPLATVRPRIVLADGAVVHEA